MSTQELREQSRQAKPVYKALALSGGTSLTLVLDKRFAIGLGLTKGDYVRITQDGNRLIVEKAE